MSYFMFHTVNENRLMSFDTASFCVGNQETHTKHTLMTLHSRETSMSVCEGDLALLQDERTGGHRGEVRGRRGKSDFSHPRELRLL